MGCRVGMSTDPEERIEYWMKIEGLTGGEVLHRNKTYDEAQRLEGGGSRKARVPLPPRRRAQRQEQLGRLPRLGRNHPRRQVAFRLALRRNPRCGRRTAAFGGGCLAWRGFHEPRPTLATPGPPECRDKSVRVAALTSALEEPRKSILPRRLRIIVPPRAKEGGPITEVGARDGE